MKRLNSCTLPLVAPLLLCNALTFAQLETPPVKAVAQVHKYYGSTSRSKMDGGGSHASFVKYFNESNVFPEAVVADFAGKMMGSIVELDPDVAKALHENFWDLI